MTYDKTETKILKYFNNLVKKGSSEEDINAVILNLAEQLKLNNTDDVPVYFG